MVPGLNLPSHDLIQFVLNFKRKITVVLLLMLLCCLWLPSQGFATKTTPTKRIDPTFPEYPIIQPNVQFWIDVFTKYSNTQGIMHHSLYPDIVYGVISLKPSTTKRNKRINKKRRKAAHKKYQQILTNLAIKNKNLTKEEKRVAALFGLKTSSSAFRRAAGSIRCQVGLKDQFKEGLLRAGPLLKEFKRIFQSYGLPLDLVYLPCVESSFNLKAYSKFGAAGIWQFTRSTGKRYMNIGYVVDERRDPYISTDAAARLLKRNYENIKEWPFAITAYNHGLSGMMRAKKSKGSYENVFKSYRSRSFKFASRNFYSEFLAARHVAKNHQKYFGPLKFKKPHIINSFKTKNFLSAPQLSGHLKISLRQIQDLNPSLRKPVFTGQKLIPKGFNLRLPLHISPGAIKNIPMALYKNAQKPSRFHIVKKGETAGKISRIHGVRLHDLIMANGLNRRATIYIGQTLRVPVKGEIIIARAPQVKKIKKKTAPKPSIKPLKKVGPKQEAIQAEKTKIPTIKPVLVAEKPPIEKPGKKNTESQKPEQKQESNLITAVVLIQPGTRLKGNPIPYLATTQKPDTNNEGPIPIIEVAQARPITDERVINPAILTENLKI
ncbi:MAG: transglycosylase SLT domain-containing protein, partial [Desulfobacteraceae bacterium]|nr:transglycosylase SLT domain-containing protein [Desulfobacteraceae bacterium]